MLDPNYVVGLVDGEGCFSITINRNDDRLPEVRLLFEIEMREDDEPILRKVQETLGCGNIYRLQYERYEKWRPHVKYKVSNFSDMTEKIIPFFTKHPLQAKKRFDFQKFVLVAELMKTKQHLRLEGLQTIQAIKRGDSLSALDAHA